MMLKSRGLQPWSLQLSMYGQETTQCVLADETWLKVGLTGILLPFISSHTVVVVTVMHHYLKRFLGRNIFEMSCYF